MQSMEALITLSQLRWTGHVIRMSENRLPRNLLYSELNEDQPSAAGDTGKRPGA